MNKAGRIAVGVGVGALAGIGIITLSPAFAAVGMITAAGAVVGGAGGGMVGGGVAYANDPKDAIDAASRRAGNEARNQAKAEHEQQLKELVREFDAIRLELAPHAKRTQLQLAMHRVGVACLAACQAVTSDNLLQLREFIFGAVHDTLSAKLEEKLRAAAERPGSLKAARSRALLNHPDDEQRFEQVAALMATLYDVDGANGLAGHWAQLRASGGAA